MSPDDPRHGTNAGYIAHRRLGERACLDCMQGRAIYQRRRNYDKELGRPRTVSSIGVQRRVRALQRLGWSIRAIARESGWSCPQDLHYVMRNPGCNRKTWIRIARTYERLCMTPPPVTSGSVRARLRAERLGFPPPLAWNNIDDPNERPDLGGADDLADPVVVDRLLAGQRVRSNRAEKVEAMRRWLASGRSQRSLCEIHGWQHGRYVDREDGAA